MICTWKCRQLAVVSGMPNRGFPCSYELLVNGDQQCRRDTDPDAAVSSSPSPPTVCPIEGCYTPIPSAHPARTRSVTHHHPSPPPLPALYYPRRPVGPLQRYGAVRSAGADRALPPPAPALRPAVGSPRILPTPVPSWRCCQSSAFRLLTCRLGDLTGGDITNSYASKV